MPDPHTSHPSPRAARSGGRSYDSREEAAAAIAQGQGWHEVVLSPSWSDDEDNSCWSAYETQEACDADDTGAMAPCITRRIT